MHTFNFYESRLPDSKLNNDLNIFNSGIDIDHVIRF